MLHRSSEDYLKTIYVLHMNSGTVRSVDVAEHLGVTKPSVCNAIRVLKEGGFLIMDERKRLSFTETGREMAKRIYERHCILREALISIGISREIAERDACRIEHDISRETFEKLKDFLGNHTGLRSNLKGDG